MSELKVAPQKATGNSATDNVTFKQVIKGLSQRTVKTTAHRKDLMSDLVGNIPSHGLTKETALQAISMIDAVAERSHSYTIASPEIVGAINNCIHTICGYKMNWSDFIREHGALIANFLQKMRDSNREKKIYQPGRYGDSELKIVDQMFSNFEPSSDDKVDMPPPVPQNLSDGCVRTSDGAITGDWNG